MIKKIAIPVKDIYRFWNARLTTGYAGSAHSQTRTGVCDQMAAITWTRKDHAHRYPVFRHSSNRAHSQIRLIVVAADMEIELRVIWKFLDNDKGLDDITAQGWQHR